MMVRFPFCAARDWAPALMSYCLASLPMPPLAAAQVTYGGGISVGRAFMLDLDDPDPAGAFSASAALERRSIGKSISIGLEGGLHRYLVLRQDLPLDVTGWASKLEDTREAWRVTPFVRWGTQGRGVRLYAQLGAGLYVRQSTYFQQERQNGTLVVDLRHAATDPSAGVHLGLGLELFPGTSPVGIGVGFRAHSAFGGGDGFNTGEIGIVFRGRSTSRRAAGDRVSGQ